MDFRKYELRKNHSLAFCKTFFIKKQECRKMKLLLFNFATHIHSSILKNSSFDKKTKR